MFQIKYFGNDRYVEKIRALNNKEKESNYMKKIFTTLFLVLVFALTVFAEDTVKDFTLKTMDGKTVTGKSLRGDPFVVNVAGTW
jgi:hypothetical protein